MSTSASPTSRSGPDPFCSPLFGAAGWTDPLAKLVSAYGVVDPDSGWIEFYSLPATALVALDRALLAAERLGGFTQWPYLFSQPAQLAQELGAATGVEVTSSGRLVRPPRPDERLELTQLRLELTSDSAQLVERVHALLSGRYNDYTLAVEHSGDDGDALVVCPPREL